MNIYGERIATLRDKAGLKQADLAFDCDWRTSRLSNYENGHRSPALKDIEIIAKALDQYLGGHTIVYLMTGSFVNELAKKTSKKQFTPAKAVSIFRDVISNAVEFGHIKTSPRFKLMDLVRSFSKACNATSSGNQKTSQLESVSR